MQLNNFVHDESEPMDDDLFFSTAETLSRRNEIYLKLLEIGLLQIRDAARAGDTKRCEIESEHLHNIPTLIACGDAAHHGYYWTKERPWYIECLRHVATNQSTLAYCERLWGELESLIPLKGTPWETDAKEQPEDK